MGFLIAPCFFTNLLEFTPVKERVASLGPQVGEWVLTVVYSNAPNNS